MRRASGILLHISSLPGAYGIGTLGEEAYRFADLLAEAGITYWQVLPLCPTGPSNSPYSGVSCFANNQVFVDPAQLAADGYLTAEEAYAARYQASAKTVDYAFVNKNAESYLRLAFSRMDEEKRRELLAFVNAESYWLVDYALYTALAKHFAYTTWQDWPSDFARRYDKTLTEFSLEKENIKEIEFIYFCQWQFRRQWENLKAYANRLGVRLIGDMPIFPDLNSADVWANPEIFQLDETGYPTARAGVPPDYFSEDGQLWGNPLYDWDIMEQNGYDWWVERIRQSMKLFDVVRIDHFRGFESYWAVPAESKTARLGVWRKGPGMKLFDRVAEELEDVEIIAENLGDINQDVEDLLEESGFPGMEVLQFAFGDKEKASALPYTYKRNNVAYTGTHDNNTVLGWLKEEDEEVRRFALDYVRAPQAASAEELGPAQVRCFAEACWESSCDLAVAPIQDLLGMDESKRMNTPGTNNQNNWVFRITEEELAELDIKWLRRMNEVFQRMIEVPKTRESGRS